MLRRIQAFVMGLTALFSVMSTTVQAQELENATILSVAESIYAASGQAQLYLVQGIYVTRSGGNEFRFEIPAEMRSTLKFRFEEDALVSASWDFQQAITVQITSGGKCVRLIVKRFEYEEGGFLSGKSDQTIVPTGPCRESEPLSRLDDFLRLSTDTGDFFTGRAFVSFNRLAKCVDATCSTTVDGLPIRLATFFNTAAGPGFAAAFRPNSSIILPDSGFLVLGAGSATSFKELSYDLETDTGSAQLTEFKVTVSDGVIVGGDTILRLKQGSELTASGFDIDKEEGAVNITGATLSGALGQGTSIALTHDEDRLSLINIQSASATFAGLQYSGSGSSARLAILRGQVNSRIESAELWFTDRNSVRFGFTTIDLTLGCPETTAEADCAPVEWSDDGLRVTGTISNFATSLTGGSFNVTNVGDVHLKSGQVVADRLEIDTSDDTSPITGKVNKVEISLEGQDLLLDDSTSVRVAQASATSTDLSFVKGESLPVGEVLLSGSIDRLEGQRLGEVEFVAGATFEFKIVRAEHDDPALLDGRLDGNIQVAMSEGNRAAGNLKVRDLRYYRGFGEAMLEVEVSQARYQYFTPAAFETKDLTLVEAEINLHSIKLVGSLVQPLRFGPTKLKSFNKSWRIEPIVGAPFIVEVAIDGQELVYAPIKEKLAGTTVCAPKVSLRGQKPRIAGKIDVFASSTQSGVHVYDGQLTPGIDADADDRGCSEIGAAVCFLVGSAFGGVIGGAALGVMCRDTIEEGERELETAIRDESMRKVETSEFRFTTN